MGDRRSVRAELERKRIQLAQMRQERERRSRMLQEDENSVQNLDNRERLDDADAVLQALGLSASLSRASTAPSNVSSMDQSRSMNAASPDVSQLIQQQHQQYSTSLNEPLTSQSSQHNQPSTRASVPLQVVHVNQINIAPKERVLYTKSTQTPVPASQTHGDQDSQSGEGAPQPKPYYGKQHQANPLASPIISNGQRVSSSISGANGLSNNTQGGASINQFALEWDDEFPVLTYQDDDDEHSSDFSNIPNGRQSKTTGTGAGLPHMEMVKPAEIDSASKGSGAEKTAEIRELNEDERRQIELREDYQQFIDRATKVLERALYENEGPEIFVRYFPEDGDDDIDSERKKSGKLSPNRIFFDEKWSKNRCVTDFDWSVQYPELLLASYFTNQQAPSDPDGALLVWNMKFKNTSPEFIFHCQSPIMSCCFAKFHPSLIVGGTYSGQIVLWDMRSHKKTPVQRSPLTATAHTHPVYCVKVVGTQNAHNLISISTDGKLCSWSLDMLSAPQETMELNQQKQTRSVAVTCMSFHPDDYNNFLVGSEEGTVYSACRHGSKTGILSSFESHQGLITSVDYQPMDSQSGYSNLFLTSSIDWTVKLWDSKKAEPIHSFESNGDYVYDVKWSPNNPDLFATADGDGRVDIWNWASDLELPIASAYVQPAEFKDAKSIQPSLNKLIWAPSGNQVIVGDDVGRIHVYDIGDVGDTKRVQSIA